MSGDDRNPGPNKAEHQRRAAEALRENLRRRKAQAREIESRGDPANSGDPALPKDSPSS